ncbi:hypothetical protein QQX98_007919 [Neonectria punicea]|uniref:Uncharacterized protein n=1 Tax=Neonectria punicea TaxID=979145 RepID=A0ABR1GWK8_9HYPO
MRMDPLQDTLQVWRMHLPKNRPTPYWNFRMLHLHQDALPFRKIMNIWDTPRSPAGRILRPPDDLRSQEISVDTAFCHPLLPLLNEATLTLMTMPPGWWIHGLQTEGPHITSWPRRDQVWNRKHRFPTEQKLKEVDLDCDPPCPNESKANLFYHPVDPKDIEGAVHYHAHGIPADTGIRWMVDTCSLTNSDGHYFEDRIHPTLSLRSHQVLPGNRTHHICPNIGFHGYSKGWNSMGGQWAVEFSALAYSDVESVLRKSNPALEVDGNMYMRHHPQFIAKVWIVKEGQDPVSEPHHHWTEVISTPAELRGHPDSEETRRARGIAHVWKMVRGMLLEEHRHDHCTATWN